MEINHRDPGCPYELAFIEHAPNVFGYIRQNCLVDTNSLLKAAGISDLLYSLFTGHWSIMKKRRTEAKSGAFFYTSVDGKYVIGVFKIVKEEFQKKKKRICRKCIKKR